METPIMNAKKKFPVWAIALMVLAVIIVVPAVVIVSGKSTEAKLAEKLELAQQYISELNYEQAIAMLNEALEIDPKAIEAYSGLVDVYIAMGDEEKAREVLAQAQEEFPAEAVAELKAKVEEAYGALPEATEAGQAAANYPTAEYDQNGNVIKKFVYVDGSITQWCTYEYDENGELIKETWYNADGIVHSVIEYANGNKVKVTDHNSDGSIFVIYEYDENGRQVKSTVYNDDRSYRIDEYENGNRIKSTYYNADGTVTGWTVLDYDENGIEIKNTSYRPDGSVKYTNDYENGKIVKHTIYDPDGSVSQWYISEYDANGNKVKETLYDADGSVISVTESTR